MAITTSTTTQPGLARDLADFLLELGLALQRHALYPGGHPSVDAAVADLTRRVGDLLREREVLSLGVARRQLVMEGVATEASHPVLRSVAERLHRHRIGVMTFVSGLTPSELSSALHAVSQDPDGSGGPLGLKAAERMSEWVHVRFHTLTYDQLQLADADGEEEAAEGVVGGRGTAASELWLGLARAALSRGDWSQEETGDADPGQVARAINEQHGEQAYDQVIVGFLLQLAEELRREQGGGGTVQVRRRVSQVVRQLDPATLDRLMEMGGDGAQRARFLHHAARGLRPDAVLDILGAAARAEGQDISTSMLRLLRKLSTAAELGVGDGGAEADGHLREQVRSLLAGWSLTDPNPGSYTAALESMSRSLTAGAEGEDGHATDPLRLVQMSVEIGVVGVASLRAACELIGSGRLEELYAVIDGAEAGNPAVAALWRELEGAEHVRRVFTVDPVDFDSLDRLLPRLPLPTKLSLLLDRIAESESRATRMGIYLRLVSHGLPVAPLALERLADPRWYVLRNMLLLVNEIGSWPADFRALPLARHPQPNVRREALQLAVRIPSEREEAIRLALGDADERALRIGVNAARETGLPAAAVGVAATRLREPDLSLDVVTSLLRLLAGHAGPEVADAILAWIIHGRRLLGGVRLAPRSPQMLAALGSLTRMPTPDARCSAALELARASTDPEIRTAAAAAAPA